MINSLVVKNFKCLENLEIRKLSRINLFTGKNNTGKSTLLEAIALFASKGELDFLFRILKDRGVLFDSDKDDDIEKLSGLFSNWKRDFSSQGAIVISELNSAGKGDVLSYRLTRYIEEDVETDSGIPFVNRITIDDDSEYIDNIEFYIGLQRAYGGITQLFPISRLSRWMEVRTQQGATSIHYIRHGVTAEEVNSKLWDKITLTSKESQIIDALKIIQPSISGLSFIDSGRNRVPIARLNDTNVVFPFKSLGDGMNRILTLLLALVNAQNGVLLIDEFENGLHYTVQKELWKMILQLSIAMDVQVFATTHSSDCIHSFSSIIEESGDLNVGTLVRLDNRAGCIQPVEYSQEEIKIAKQFDLETR